jgi:hypothetical protein
MQHELSAHEFESLIPHLQQIEEFKDFFVPVIEYRNKNGDY